MARPKSTPKNLKGNRVAVYLDDLDHARLARLARHYRESMAALVRAGVRDYLERYERASADDVECGIHHETRQGIK